MEPPTPPARFFRRSVGLRVRLSACAPDTAHVTVPRPGGALESSLATQDLPRLLALSRWCSARASGLHADDLSTLVRDGLLVFHDGDCPRADLSGAPLPSTAVHARWRGNAWVTPIFNVRGAHAPLPFMPRRRDLSGATAAGLHVALMERGHATFSVGLACCARHGGRLAALEAALTSGVEVHRLDAQDRVLVDLLGGAGVLEDATTPREHPRVGGVTWLGHASVLVDQGPGGARVLVDPLFHPRDDPARRGAAVPPDPRELPPPDVVCITHGDNDHFNPAALARLPRDLPVIIPRASRRRAFHVDMPGVLARLGFRRVHAAVPWERVVVRGTTVLCAPFHGEDWGLPLPQLTFAVGGPSFNVYLSADAAFMPAVYPRVAREIGGVDVAFLGVGGCEEAHVMPPAWGYGNFYAAHVPRRDHNRWVRHCAAPDDSARAARLLGARHVFGYAAGGAPYIRVAYSDRGTHGQLARRLGEPGDPVPLDLEPGVALPWPPPRRVAYHAHPTEGGP